MLFLFTKFSAGAKSYTPALNFIIGGGGGDVKGCMLNTGVGHSASASYSLLLFFFQLFQFKTLQAYVDDPACLPTFLEAFPAPVREG